MKTNGSRFGVPDYAASAKLSNPPGKPCVWLVYNRAGALLGPVADCSSLAEARVRAEKIYGWTGIVGRVEVRR